MFSESEVRYIRSQPLGRLAAASKDGQPDVVPVGFEFDGRNFYIGSLMTKKTRKFWSVPRGNPWVSFVVDDIKSLRPWGVSGVKINDKAEVVEVEGSSGRGGQPADNPDSHKSWGID
jgi:pyridoxamine 5'-phosphate oxidase family protein